jgi:type III secretion protein J
MRWKWLAALTLWAVVGCSAEVYHGLSERQANELVVALEESGIAADKSPDPAGEATWLVSVARGERVRAWQLLESQGLPRPETGGFDEFYPSGGLIPTSGEERVILQYATAEELRKTLLKIDSVVDAQVNLVLPEKPRIRLEHTKVEPPRASVLVVTRPEPEVTPEEVRRLVAGGVEGLAAQRVEVVLKTAPVDRAKIGQPDLATVGPVSVAPESQGMLRAVIGGMGAIIVLLAGGTMYLLWRRGFRERHSDGPEVA